MKERLNGIIIEKAIFVSMRDGTRLATDVYRPAIDGRFPVVLVRTCYDKNFVGHSLDCAFFAERGYVVVTQDVRGRYASEGSYRHGATEAADGYDTVEWIAKQSYSDGKIGMTGISYLAAVQSAAAIANPPHLKALFHVEGPSNYYFHCFREGGALMQLMIPAAFYFAATGKEANSNKAIEKALLEQNMPDWLTRAPLLIGRTPLALTKEYETWLFDIMNHPDYDQFWKNVELWVVDEYLERHADIPVFHVGGWYDLCSSGTTGLYSSLRSIKNSPQRMLVGPWVHGNFDHFCGDVDFGPDAAIDPEAYSRLMLKWFDYTLKGVESEATTEKPVRIFVMGGGDGRKDARGRMVHGGRWREENEWPLTRTKYTNYFVRGDGVLSTDLPTGRLSSSYAYDPENPVPTIGGTSFFSELSRSEGAEKLSINDRLRYFLPIGPQDQRERSELFACRTNLPLASRHDVLVFSTPPLTEDIEVTGPLKVNLWGSSTAVDTDFTAKLVDVHPPNEDYPEGYAMNLSDSIIRARYRNSFEKAEFMEPGEVYPFTINMRPTSNLFTRGHRIRLDISSSNFPNFDINPNTGGSFLTGGESIRARNSVYHDGPHPSHVVLPIVSSADV